MEADLSWFLNLWNKLKKTIANTENVHGTVKNDKDLVGVWTNDSSKDNRSGREYDAIGFPARKCGSYFSDMNEISGVNIDQVIR